LAFSISAVEWRGNRFFAFAMQSYAVFFNPPNFFDKIFIFAIKYPIMTNISS